ncbi:acyl carrier protein [Ceratobasidium sp. AG-I]|nr:acyl carrier protein [Ceratobasidium sp. AG-I]
MSAAFRSVFNIARTARITPVAASARSVAFARPAFVYRSYSAAAGLSQADIQTRVLDVLKSFEKVDPAKITPAASFTDDLGLDSLDAVEAVMAIEEEFSIEIPDAEADEIKTVQQAIEYIAKTPEAH